MEAGEARDAAPESLGRFQVLERLGAGASGEVLLGLDPKLQRRVAIKLLRARSEDEPSGDSELAQRLRNEARALAQLNHPNVVTVHELGSHEGRDFMVSELVEGGTLRDWCARAERSPGEIVEVFVQAGRGLAAAHGAGLVHRDFKPENVLVSADGRVRVADFGLVSVPAAQGLGVASGADDADAGDEIDVAAAALTQTGALVGTPVYMAPEQLAGEAADARSDQFAFCVALYEALAGVRPFAGKRFAELIRNVKSGQLRPASDGRPIAKALRSVIERGLSPKPAERFSDLDELVRALEAAGGARRRGSRLALAVAATGLVGVGVLVWSQRGHDDEGARLPATPTEQSAQAPVASGAPSRPSARAETATLVAPPTQPKPAASTKPLPPRKVSPAQAALELDDPEAPSKVEERARELELDEE